MYRVALTVALAGSAFGEAIAPEQEFSTKRVGRSEMAETGSGASENGPSRYAPPPSYSAGLPPGHFYPAYPEHAVQQYAPQQPGYDGFLVPAVSPQRSTWSSGIFTALVPLSTYALSYGARIGLYVWNLFVLLLIGGVLTTSVCTFTPFCTITFLGLGINKNQVREQVSELARTYITPESMNVATLLVKRAIEEYAELQREHRKEEDNRKPLDKKEKNDKRRRRR